MFFYTCLKRPNPPCRPLHTLTWQVYFLSSGNTLRNRKGFYQCVKSYPFSLASTWKHQCRSPPISGFLGRSSYLLLSAWAYVNIPSPVCVQMDCFLPINLYPPPHGSCALSAVFYNLRCVCDASVHKMLFVSDFCCIGFSGCPEHCFYLSCVFNWKRSFSYSTPLPPIHNPLFSFHFTCVHCRTLSLIYFPNLIFTLPRGNTRRKQLEEQFLCSQYSSSLLVCSVLLQSVIKLLLLHKWPKRKGEIFTTRKNNRYIPLAFLMILLWLCLFKL